MLRSTKAPSENHRGPDSLPGTVSTATKPTVGIGRPTSFPPHSAACSYMGTFTSSLHCHWIGHGTPSPFPRIPTSTNRTFRSVEDPRGSAPLHRGVCGRDGSGVARGVGTCRSLHRTKAFPSIYFPFDGRDPSRASIPISKVPVPVGTRGEVHDMVFSDAAGCPWGIHGVWQGRWCNLHFSSFQTSCPTPRYARVTHIPRSNRIQCGAHGTL